MYCVTCGAATEEGTRFCPGCGNKILPPSQNMPPPAALRGFSTRINDPAFARYIKSSNRWSALVSILLAVAAVVGFTIAGNAGVDGMSNPGALLAGLGLGGMFLIIALVQIRSRKRSATWDGTVEDKQMKKKTRHDRYSIEKYLEYSIIIRGDHEKRHVVKTRSSDLYHYFNIGDRVRHHAGLKSLEKFDKTGDWFLPCNACGTICEIHEDICPQCRCPLLK